MLQRPRRARWSRPTQTWVRRSRPDDGIGPYETEEGLLCPVGEGLAPPARVGRGILDAPRRSPYSRPVTRRSKTPSPRARTEIR